MASRLNGSTGGFVSSDSWLEYVASHVVGVNGDAGNCLLRLSFVRFIGEPNVNILQGNTKWLAFEYMFVAVC